MKKISQISMVCALALNINANDLGTINIESSTVNVTQASATEVSTVSYINEETIKEIGPKQINELLQSVPGVTADVRPGEVVEIHMRGIGQQEYMWEDSGVAVIVDGVPVYAKSGKFRLNVSDIKSIKVIKGSASYLYGNTATGGAVIITTSRPKGSKNEISFGAEFGSNKYRDYNAEFNHSNENFAVNLNANDRSTDGYWADSDYWSKSYVGKFTYYIDDSSDVTLGIDKTTKFEAANRGSTTGIDAAFDDPTGEENSSAFQKDNNVELDKYFIKYTKDFENGANILINAYKYLDKYDFISSPQDTDLLFNPMPSEYSNHSIEDKKQKGLKLEFKKEEDSFAYLLGYEYGDREYIDASETLIDYMDLGDDGLPGGTRGNADEAHYEGDTQYSEDNQKLHAFYAEIKFNPMTDLSTTFNIRRDIQDEEYYLKEISAGVTDITKLEETFTENSYRAGLVYKLNDTNSIFSNISTGFRTPYLYRMEPGDEMPATQKSITYEIGNRGSISNLDYEVTLFHVKTKDTIGGENGTYAFGGDYMNIGDSENNGLELSLKSDSKKDLSFNLAYTYLDTKVTKHNPFVVSRVDTFNIVGNELPRSPKHKLNLYTTYKPIPQLKLISEIYAQSSFYADETNLVKVPGYAYMNLQARYNLKLGAHNFELFGKINNVFDKQYIQTAFYTSDKSGDGIVNGDDASTTIAPGRQYFAGIKYTF